MIAALVCERMGWTYWDFEAAPDWFIDVLLLKWVEDTRHAKEQQKG